MNDGNSLCVTFVLFVSVESEKIGHFLFSARKVTLDGVLWYRTDVGNLFNGLSFHELKRNANTLVVVEQLECPVKVHLQIAVCRSCPLTLEVWGIDIYGFLSTSHIVVQHIIGYTKQPREERRPTLKLGDAGVGPQKGVLCKVVAQLTVTEGL